MIEIETKEQRLESELEYLLICEENLTDDVEMYKERLKMVKNRIRKIHKELREGNDQIK